MDMMSTPVALTWAEYEGERRPFQKLHRLVDVYEALLKYGAIIAVQNFYAAGLAAHFPNVDIEIRKPIARSSLGHWVGFLRETLRSFAEYEESLFSRELFLFYFKDFGKRLTPQPHFQTKSASDRLLLLRNERLGHGATMSDDTARALLHKHEGDLHLLLEQAAFLADLPLRHVEASVVPGEFRVVTFMGADYASSQAIPLNTTGLTSESVGHLVAHNINTGAFLDLYPLLLYTECVEDVPEWDAAHAHITGKQQCGRRKLFYFNDLKADDRISFLDYWHGHHSRFKKPPSLLPSEFRTRFPRPQEEGPARKADWFEWFVRDRTEYFVGRESELAALDRFAEGSSKRVLVVHGAPGMGKSGLLARWAEQRGAVRHFMREGDAATYDVARVFENLGLQVAERYGVLWERPSMPEPHEYRKAFLDTLAKASEKTRGGADGGVLLIIDGLDEAARSIGHVQGVGEGIVAWLPDPVMLPDGVRVVLSTRPELLDRPTFVAKYGRDKAEWVEIGRMSDADVRALLFQVRSKYEVLEAGEYVDAIVERSAGSPLYLRMLVEDLEEGRLTFGQVESLPSGVIAYFERILRFIESEGHARELPDMEVLLQQTRKTLDAMVVKGRLTREEADEQLEQERAALEEEAGLKSVELLALYCLAKEPLALTEASYMLQVSSVDVQRAFDVIRTVLVSSGEALFAIFHAGFREYFLNLSDYAHTKLHQYTKPISSVQGQILVYCAQWRQHRSKYALRHYSAHLYESKQYDAVFLLVRDKMFQQTQAHAFPDEPGLSLRTIQAALRAAADSGNAGTMAEFVLLHSQRVAEITQESPLGALRSGNLEKAWELADLLEAENCVLWYLLIAWELVDNSRVEDANATMERLANMVLPQLSDWRYTLADLMVKEISSKIGPKVVPRLLVTGTLQEPNKEVSTGDHNDISLESARNLEDTHARVSALVSLAEARSQAGKIEAARSIFAMALSAAQHIVGENYQIRALITIAEAQAYSGETEAVQLTLNVAREVALHTKRKVDSSSMINFIAHAQAKLGDIQVADATCDLALELAQEITGKYNRLEALANVAQVRAQLLLIAVIVYVGKDEFALALETAKKIEPEEYIVKAVIAIADGLIQGGNAQLASIIVQQMKWRGSWASQEALAVVAKCLANGGHLAVALDTAQQIKHPWHRVCALTAIAKTQAQVGILEAAQSTLILAVDSTRQIDSDRYRAQAIIAIVDAQMQLKVADLEDVVAIALQIRNSWDHFEALRAICRSYIQATKFPEALDVALRISLRFERIQMLLAIVDAQAQIGEFDGAIEVARNIEEEDMRMRALVSIAEIQTSKGKTAYARNSIVLALMLTYPSGSEQTWVQRWALKAIMEDQAQVARLYPEQDDSSVSTDTKVVLSPASTDHKGEVPLRLKFDEKTLNAFSDLLKQSDFHLPGTAHTRIDKDAQMLLISCGYSIDAAYIMCGLLARAYPEQASAIAKVVMESAEQVEPQSER